MSTDYCLEPPVLMRELFDGRLRQYGIVEKVVPDKLDPRRVLGDQRGNNPCVFANQDGYTVCLTRYALNSSDYILTAISAEFDTEVYSDQEPQYHGFNTQEEWDAAIAREDAENRELTLGMLAHASIPSCVTP